MKPRRQSLHVLVAPDVRAEIARRAAAADLPESRIIDQALREVWTLPVPVRAAALGEVAK
jgi:hypothetical protein